MCQTLDEKVVFGMMKVEFLSYYTIIMLYLSPICISASQFIIFFGKSFKLHLKAVTTGK